MRYRLLDEKFQRIPHGSTGRGQEVGLLARVWVNSPMDKWIDQLENPFETFKSWYEAGVQQTSFEPTKMTLSTIGLDGGPCSRTVLLKQVDDKGLCFFTNYKSQKGRELIANPKASLLFHWEKPEHRQIRVRGQVEKMTYEESNRYFQTRGRGSQIGAWASPQSEVIESREKLIALVKKIESQFEGKEIPCPEFWGGFRLIPISFEFWQAGADRLHDRCFFERKSDGDNWEAYRRAP